MNIFKKLLIMAIAIAIPLVVWAGIRNLNVENDAQIQSRKLLIETGSVLPTSAVWGRILRTGDIFVDTSTSNGLKTYLPTANDILTNGTFTTNIVPWSGANWSYNAGTAKHTAGGGFTQALTQGVATATIGRKYRLTFTIVSMTAGTVTPSAGGVAGSAYTAVGTFSYVFIASATTALAFTPTATFDGKLDDVTLIPIENWFIGTLQYKQTRWFPASMFLAHTGAGLAAGNLGENQVWKFADAETDYVSLTTYLERAWDDNSVVQCFPYISVDTTALGPLACETLLTGTWLNYGEGDDAGAAGTTVSMTTAVAATVNFLQKAVDKTTYTGIQLNPGAGKNGNLLALKIGRTGGGAGDTCNGLTVEFHGLLCEFSADKMN